MLREGNWHDAEGNGSVNVEESKAEVRELLNRYVSIQRKMVELEAEIVRELADVSG